MEQSKLLGKIVAVSGSNISVAPNDNLDFGSAGSSGGHRLCQIGSYVVMPQSENLVVGTIISIRDEGLAEGLATPGHHLLQCRTQQCTGYSSASIDSRYCHIAQEGNTVVLCALL